MDYWIFDDKDFDFIAGLMIDVLLSKPDNTRISEHELLIEALKGENVWWEEDGNSYNGTKITDIELHNGKYLHDYIEWNFENGVWHDTISQALTLCEKFHKNKCSLKYKLKKKINY